jgi:hypothetical protein
MQLAGLNSLNHIGPCSIQFFERFHDLLVPNLDLTLRYLEEACTPGGWSANRSRLPCSELRWSASSGQSGEIKHSRPQSCS